MRTTLSALVFFVFCLIMISCGKEEVGTANPDFIGRWYSASTYTDGETTYIIDIDENSSGYYGVTSTFPKDVYGAAKTNGNVLKIGLKKLPIDQPPMQINTPGNYWHMQLDGIEYYANKDDTFKSIYTCNSYTLCFYNETGDTIIQTIDGDSEVVPPGEAGCAITCFACTTKYSDNLGNAMDAVMVDCGYEITIE